MEGHAALFDLHFDGLLYYVEDGGLLLYERRMLLLKHLALVRETNGDTCRLARVRNILPPLLYLLPD